MSSNLAAKRLLRSKRPAQTLKNLKIQTFKFRKIKGSCVWLNDKCISTFGEKSTFRTAPRLTYLGSLSHIHALCWIQATMRLQQNTCLHLIIDSSIPLSRIALLVVVVNLFVGGFFVVTFSSFSLQQENTLFSILLILDIIFL